MGEVISIKKASGRNISESERGTTAVKLRLEPDTAEDLRDFAAKAGVSVSAVVDAAMTTIYRLNRGDLSGLSGQEAFEAFLASLKNP